MQRALNRAKIFFPDTVGFCIEFTGNGEIKKSFTDARERTLGYSLESGADARVHNHDAMGIVANVPSSQAFHNVKGTLIGSIKNGLVYGQDKALLGRENPDGTLKAEEQGFAQTQAIQGAAEPQGIRRK